ncbi:MAG: bifunctional adenosylcobinamide kinase/adenosylcobinamide-phosphate guanylyltransferase [Coriobacteriales bacterium]|nr:bifunctional adenosylcobinamide kinase/adenosylcobinamide-phosphate guanylyltransferase [Coriobacteriales bacterium]
MKILLYGGSACGKSTFAESILLSMPEPRVYFATMRPWSKFDLERVERHRRLRKDKGFGTIERYRDIEAAELGEGSILLEDLCNLVSNEMFDDDGNYIECYEKVERGLASILERCENIVLVTNDVGADGSIYSEYTQSYIHTLGRLNIFAARSCDMVIECTAGMPAVIKGDISLLDRSLSERVVDMVRSA